MIKKIILLLVVLLSVQYLVKAQSVPDSLKDNQKVKITLEGGIVKTGYLIYDNEDEIKIWSEKIGYLKIPKIQVKEISYTDKNSEASTTDFIHHNALTNSAFSPLKGDVYVRTAYYLAGCVDYGITDDLTVGLDAFYFVALNLNLRYSFKLSEKSRLAIAAGTYYSYLGGGYSRNSSLFSARAVYTFGSEENNFSIGGTFVTNFGRMETGIVHFASMKKISEKVCFLTDILFAPNLRSLNIDLNYIGTGFLGIRIKTRRDNRIDLGFANFFMENTYYNYNGDRLTERFYVPAPYVQISYKL